jgi:AAA family ATP:ADP antiporter
LAAGTPRAPAPDGSRLTPLDRVLRIFTDVRAGEGRTAILMFANVLLILCAYYFVKPLREGWLAVSEIEGFSKMELKAYSSFGQSVLLIPVVRAYGRLVGHWPRGVLITRSTLFCMSNLVVFWFLQPGFFVEHLPGTGLAFYLWVGMFGVFVVAQFWAFAADLFDDEKGRRLLPFIAIGATSGAAVGSWITDNLVGSGVLGTEYLLLAALVPLGVSIWLTRAAETSEAHEGPTPVPGQQLPEPDRSGAIDLVLHNRFLLVVAVVTLLLNWVNTNGENLLFKVVQDVLAHDASAGGIGESEALRFVRDGTTAFYANFNMWVNTVALLLQALVASRLLKYGGFGAIFLLLPVIALGSYTTMMLIPVLAVIKVMKIAENSTDYSINNTARHVLWLPMAPEVTYKAKPTIDSLFVRVGDGLAAALVLVGERFLALATRSFFAVNVSLVLLWFGLAIWVVRRHRRLSLGGSGWARGTRSPPGGR